ncbi:hypothetical protein B0H13DRAFT_1867076 [Mycena leptocephala]|nr:hypothetical protein B0H13DRAFT_1867076 [Mycena leptocephala]
MSWLKQIEHCMDNDLARQDIDVPEGPQISKIFSLLQLWPGNIGERVADGGGREEEDPSQRDTGLNHSQTSSVGFAESRQKCVGLYLQGIDRLPPAASHASSPKRGVPGWSRIEVQNGRFERKLRDFHHSTVLQAPRPLSRPLRRRGPNLGGWKLFEGRNFCWGQRRVAVVDVLVLGIEFPRSQNTLAKVSIKYIHKAADSTHYRVKVSTHNDANPEPIYETEDYWNTRCLSAGEAAWRILGFHIAKKYPAYSKQTIRVQGRTRAYFVPVWQGERADVWNCSPLFHPNPTFRFFTISDWATGHLSTLSLEHIHIVKSVPWYRLWNEDSHPETELGPLPEFIHDDFVAF